jgi:excisionase family DNA binding protein
MSEATSSGRRPGIDDGWLTIVEVSWRLGLIPKTVARLISSGELPTTQVEGRRRVAPKDLDAFIEGRRVPPGSLEHLHTVPQQLEQPSGDRRRAEG